MPKVSIILPSYNHASFLDDRLNSIIKQTFTDWELIIIDDKSTDNSLEILQAFKNRYSNKIAHFIINKTNSGSGYNSWKKGIEIAKSEYIWIAETDDYADLTFLENLVKALDENLNAAFVFCTSTYVNTNKESLYTSKKRTRDLETSTGCLKSFHFQYFIDKLPFNSYITNGSAVLFRRPIEKIPKAIFSQKQSSDIFLWTYLVLNKRFVFVNKPLNYFRRHEDSTTFKNTKNRLLKIYEEKIIYLNYFKFSHKKSMFVNHYFNHYVWLNKKTIFNTKVFNSLNFSVLYYVNLLPNIIKKYTK